MIATYRLQLTKGFTLRDAQQILPYLKKLGVSDVYLSPVFESVPDSMHGYDGIDFMHVSQERGGEEALFELDEMLQNVDMGMILDIVPNHMAAKSDNPYWADVLAKGRNSSYWPYFDIRVSDGERICLPVLGGEVGELIDKGEIIITSGESGQPCIKYWDQRFPLKPETVKSLTEDLSSLGAAHIKEILADQHYELVHWQDASQQVSYRRFFDITDLIGLRQEDEGVYRHTHEKILFLLRSLPSIKGVRVDHIDGLTDPTLYLKYLIKDVSHIWVEKILSGQEKLPAHWPVEGTTGYEFINHVNRVFIQEEGFNKINHFWRTHIQSRWDDFVDCIRSSKKEILETLFSAELKRLAGMSGQTLKEQEEAYLFWLELTVALPVYRIYAGRHILEKEDMEWVKKACAIARKNNPKFKRLEKQFLPTLLTPKTAAHRQALSEWQQLSGPAMAKGLEDTAHYRYTPLTPLNEVGCEVEMIPNSKEVFCQFLKTQMESYPLCLKATSTHDTKRSEDTRARLYALSEMPDEWNKFYETARKLNIAESPGEETEYFLYQSIIGIWPHDNHIDDTFRERVSMYMQKVIREAKLQTSWRSPDDVYEKKVENFCYQILCADTFVTLAGDFARRLSLCGALNSLSIQTLKILSPGIPDLYQGSELWDFSLVDPDNRRPVNYELRQKILSELSEIDASEGREVLLRHLTRNWHDGAIKLWLTQQLLQFRRAFLSNDSMGITSIDVNGGDEHLIAYSLSSGKTEICVVLPRFTHSLLPVQADTLRELNISGSIQINKGSGSSWKNLITDKQIAPGEESVYDLLKEFPVAVLVSL